MHASTVRGIGVLGGFLTLAVLVSVMSSPVTGQGPEEEKRLLAEVSKRAETKKDTSQYLLCIQCHRPGGPFKDDLVRLDEGPKWVAEDYHFCAFEVLKSELGGRMNTNLKKSRPQGYEVTADAQCLACHASYTGSPKAKGDNPKGSEYDTSLGVQCEACHGVSKPKDGKGWLVEHQQVDWRKITPEVKFQDYGLVDLRDPAVRAEKCASCHVGSPSEGKFVTHEMYAAGHPPLPAFELLSFSTEEPMHWNRPKDVKYLKDLQGNNPSDAKRLFHFEADDDQDVRLVAVGAIVSFRQNLALLVETAKSDLVVKKGELLDFSLFDCYACHHDLKYPSKRQEVGYVGPPGRPVMRGTTVLLRTVTESADSSEVLSKELDAQLEKVRAAMSVRAFGDPEQVIVTANQMIEWCDKRALVAVNKMKFDPETKRQFVSKLIDAGINLSERMKKDPFDMEAGRQVATAVTHLLVDDPRKMMGSPYEKALQKIGENTAIFVRPEKRPSCMEGPVAANLKARNDLLNKFDPDLLKPGFTSLFNVFSKTK